MSTIAEMTVRALTRRRLSLLLLVALPLLFYVARHGLAGQSIRFLAIGMAWALSTIALFAALHARATEPRLRISGYSSAALVGGRVLGVLAIAAALTVLYALLLVVDRPVDRIAQTTLVLGLTALTAVATGTALGAIVKREQDGALLLFIVAGLQFIADPPTLLAHVLPFWSTRELGTWAVDGPAAASAGDAVLHAAATLLACAAATLLVSGRRLRDRRWTSRRSRTYRPAL